MDKIFTILCVGQTGTGWGLFVHNLYIYGRSKYGRSGCGNLLNMICKWYGDLLLNQINDVNIFNEFQLGFVNSKP